MQRGLGGAAIEPVPVSRDRELTLGPFVLTFIGCGLFALCGLCFVFGYAVGHSNGELATTASLPVPGSPAVTQAANPPSKPSAGQSGAQGQQAVEPTDPTAAADADSAPAPDSATPASANPAESAHTVLASQPGAAQPAPGSGAVQPALGQASGIVVQIAAVSHPEDADVLVSALRKRGYAVTARRDPTDGLLHVQIGPFANRNDAYAMRQKLLNDGYNAIVQP
jgi:DedD protein